MALVSVPVLQSLSTAGTLKGFRAFPFTFRAPGLRRPVFGQQRFVRFVNFLEFFLRPLRVILQDVNFAGYMKKEISKNMRQTMIIWKMEWCFGKLFSLVNTLSG